MRLSLFGRRRKDPETTVPLEFGRTLLRWTVALYLCNVAAALSLCAMAFLGMQHDMQQVRATFIDSEMDRMRSHGVRTVFLIQDELHRQGQVRFDERFRRESFLRAQWERPENRDDSWLYSAIVDSDGTVFMHSRRRHEGEALGRVWYDRLVTESNEGDVVETQAVPLTDGQRGFDVAVPIIADGKQIGDYHVGLSYAWLERELAEKEKPIKRTWSWIMGGILLLVVIFGVSLLQIGRRLTVLRETAKLSQARRLAEVGQLVTSIVHEVRNPLNALRLNLHALSVNLQRSPQVPANGEVPSPSADQHELLRETDREIEGIDTLLTALLGYGRLERYQAEDLDVRLELRMVLLLLKFVLERAEVAVRASFAQEPLFVQMDRQRFRQVAINLIKNAQEATGAGGEIQIRVGAAGEQVEIVVADNGPGVVAADSERIFALGYSTKEQGNGLGLTLVRRFIEDAGGSVACEPNRPRGALFRVRLPSTIKVQPDLENHPLLS